MWLIRARRSAPQPAAGQRPPLRWRALSFPAETTDQSERGGAAGFRVLTSVRDRAKVRRIDELFEWLGGSSFEGTLVFDECHKAKNFKEGDAGTKVKTKDPRSPNSHAMIFTLAPALCLEIQHG